MASAILSCRGHVPATVTHVYVHESIRIVGKRLPTIVVFFIYICYNRPFSGQLRILWPAEVGLFCHTSLSLLCYVTPLLPRRSVSCATYASLFKLPCAPPPPSPGVVVHYQGSLCLAGLFASCRALFVNSHKGSICTFLLVRCSLFDT